MVGTGEKIGHALAKGLGIKLVDPNQEAITRGESVFSVKTSDTFIEGEPTTGEWIRETLPTGKELISYGRSLFPFTYWIGRYNLQWLAGDLVAGK
jgi:sodium-independent sulfate anion transporter 11